MTSEQIKILTKMKKLIKQGYKKFICWKDRDYLQELLNIGITENEAWNEILLLSRYDFWLDYRPFYHKKDNDALIFKKKINDNIVYIKLKIEIDNNNEMTVCLSFHKDYSKGVNDNEM